MIIICFGWDDLISGYCAVRLTLIMIYDFLL